MLRVSVLSLVAIGTLFGCLSTQSSRAPATSWGAPSLETPEGSMTFFVREPGGFLVSGVSVIAVNSRGLTTLGNTGEHGEYTIGVELLKAHEPYALVFCHEVLPCGALLVRGEFYGYRERNVILPPAEFY